MDKMQDREPEKANRMTAVGSIQLKRWGEAGKHEELITDIDAIFFSASVTQEFPSPSVRDAFRERWLGRYLEHDPSWFYVALAGDRAIGYLAGCLDDPARTPRFADIDYFASFVDLTRDYPAHLHINLDENYRNSGLGTRLIERFAGDAAAAGVRGVHVVTGARARNRSFYNRNGFVALRELVQDPKEVVFLGRRLPA